MTRILPLIIFALAACDGTVESSTGPGNGGTTSTGGTGTGTSATEGAAGTSSSTCPPTLCTTDGTPQEWHDACDDGNPQTSDRCVKPGACWICMHTPVECDWIEPAETQAVVCDDANDCTTDRCATTDSCVHEPQNEDRPCADRAGTCSQDACEE